MADGALPLADVQIDSAVEPRLKLRVLDRSRIEWVATVPCPPQGEKRRYEVVCRLDVPDHLWRDHEPLRRFRARSRLQAPSKAARAASRLSPVDAVRHQTLLASRRFKRSGRRVLRVLRRAQRKGQLSKRRDEAVATRITTLHAALIAATRELERIGYDGDLAVEREVALGREFLSARALTFAALALARVEPVAPGRSGPLDAPVTRAALAELVRAERADRKARGEVVASAADPDSQRGFLRRYAALKKHFHSLLFLEAEVFEPDAKLSNWIAALVAVLASTWAFTWQIAYMNEALQSRQTLISLLSTGLVAGLLYAVKDRIKDLGKRWLSRWLRDTYADRVVHLYLPGTSPGRDTRVASSVEQIGVEARLDADPLNPSLGASRPVHTVQVRMRMQQFGLGAQRSWGVRALKHVMRYDLSPLLPRMEERPRYVVVDDADADGAGAVAAVGKSWSMPVRVELHDEHGEVVMREKRRLLLSPRGLLRLLPAALVFCGLVLGSAATLSGCSDDDGKDPPEDVVADGAGVDGAVADGAAGDGSAADGGGQDVCPPPPAAQGTARARVLGCDEALPTGAMVAARTEDVVLENARARFVLRVGPEGEAIAGTFGAHIVDAVLLDGSGEAASVDGLREWVPLIDMHTVRPTDVELDEDEATGAAVVRVEGDLVPFEVVHGFVSLPKPAVAVVQEFRLAPDTTALELNTIIKATDGAATPLVADATFWSGGLGLFEPAQEGPLAWFGIARSHARPDLAPAAIGFPKSVSTLDAGGILAFLHPTELVDDEGLTIKRWLVLGARADGGLAAAFDRVAALREEAFGRVSGQVSGFEAAGTDAAPGLHAGLSPDNTVLELLSDAGGPLARCDIQSDASFDCPAPAGTRGLRVRWLGNGDGQAGEGGQLGAITDVPAAGDGLPDASGLAVSAPSPARLLVRVEDELGAKLPYQLVAVPTGELAGAGTRWFSDADGQGAYLLPAGTWDCWLHHGPEWSMHHASVDVAVGVPVELSATLAHVVDTDGWISADTHIHGEHSSDSDVPSRERLLDAIAVGIDYAVATDHDHVTDHAPLLAEMGLSDKLTVAPGVEVSTAQFGHHNTWPLVPDPDKSGNGAVRWYGVDAADLLVAMRAGDPMRVLQSNHPRGSQSYFEGIDFGPDTDPAELAFDAIEVLNGKRIDDAEEVIADMHVMLGRGMPKAAMGTSDSHSVSSNLGNARTFIRLEPATDGSPRDLQGQFSAAEADAAIRAHRTVASTGPFLRPTLEGGGQTAHVGDTLDTSGGVAEVTFKVHVQAPEWMPMGILTVYRDGAVVLQEDLSETAAMSGLKVAERTITEPASSAASWWQAVIRHKPGVPRPPIQKRETWAVTSALWEAP